MDDDVEIRFDYDFTIENENGKQIDVLSCYGEPKKYLSLDLLEGCFLEGVEGNRLMVSREGNSEYFYLHECFDALYLTKNPREPNEEIYTEDETPFEDFIGKKITKIEKDFFSYEDKEKDLPWRIRICSEDCPNLYEIVGDDGVIVTMKKPSKSYMISRVLEITKKEEISDDELEELKDIRKKLRLPIFDQEKLQERNPELYERFYKS